MTVPTALPAPTSGLPRHAGTTWRINSSASIAAGVMITPTRPAERPASRITASAPYATSSPPAVIAAIPAKVMSARNLTDRAFCHPHHRRHLVQPGTGDAANATATYATEHSAVGPQVQLHNLVDTFVQALGRHPGHGIWLIRLSLQGPVIRNRWLTLLALGKWPHDAWTPEIRALIEDLAAVEPQQKTRDKVRELLGYASA